MRKTILFIAICCIIVSDATGQALAKPWYISERAGKQQLDLSGKWWLSHADSAISSPQEWKTTIDPFETNVPNGIHWSLYEAGKLPHPYYHKNSDRYNWVDEKVWYYRKKFVLPAEANGKYALLCFDGLDYFSRVWVNDELLGSHEGMFGGPNIEISRLLKYGAENEIMVELKAGNWGNKASSLASLPRTSTGDYDFSKRTGFNPRASGPIIKPWVISGGSGCEMFFSIGMWQGVRLELVPKIHLERPYLVTQSVTPEKALLRLTAEVLVNEHSLQQSLHPWNNTQLRHPDEKGYAFRPVKQSVQLMVELLDGSRSVSRKTIPLQVFEGRNWVAHDLQVDRPQLWYPNGMGKAHLYQVKLSLLSSNNNIDVTSFDVGIRTIERQPTPGPRTGDRYENWQFLVNGKKLFVKGMNFTPQDVLLNTSPERYRWTLEAAKRMGVQLIRIWGGGLLETNTFYQLCDSLGLMVWQDFPIGNQDTPGYPQEIWEAQVVQNIFRLRNHPSLVMWCGGNEFNPYSYGNAASIGILERNLQTFDNSRLFVRTTPDAGSIHAYPDMDPSWYKRSYGKEAWISETGMHSMPEAGLFYETVDKKEFFGLGRMWEKTFADAHPEFIHHFTEYGPSRVPRMLSRASHIDDMRDPSLESITEASQVGAGEFYQVLSEKTQGNYPVTAGLMPWVFKRHWPVIAIQMMDWFGQAGAPYYFLKRSYESQHVALDLDRLLWKAGETIPLPIVLLNANTFPGKTYTVSVSVMDDAYHELLQKEFPARLAEGPSVTRLPGASFQIPASYKDRFLFLRADLKDEKGKLISRSTYFPRVLVQMEDKVFYDKYLSTPIPWITLDKGPWLKPTAAANRTTLSVALIRQESTGNNQSTISFAVRNTGKYPAFMTQFDIKNAKRAFYATDNYFWLEPGEKKEVTLYVQWREQTNQAQLEGKAWNAPAVVQTLQ